MDAPGAYCRRFRTGERCVGVLPDLYSGPRRDAAVSRRADHPSKDTRQQASGQRTAVNDLGTRDEEPQRAIESPLRSELAASRVGQPVVDATPAMGQRFERRAGGQGAPADGEPQAVTRHRIDEPGRVAGDEEAIDPLRRGIDRQRSENCRRREMRRASAKRSRSRGSRASSSARSVAENAWAKRVSPLLGSWFARGRRSPGRLESARRRYSGRAARAFRRATTDPSAFSK